MLKVLKFGGSSLADASQFQCAIGGELVNYDEWVARGH